MPKIIDERARREDIAEAVWSLADREGLGSATVRAVATECGLSVGAIQHSFPTQAALQQFAMELIVQRATQRINALGSTAESDGEAFGTSCDPGTRGTNEQSAADAPAESGVSCDSPQDERVATVAEMLLQLLPLDQERETEARVWSQFCAAALTNDALAPYAIRMNRLLESFCRACLEHLAPDANASATHVSSLHGLLDGLALQLLIDSSPARRDQARRTVLEAARAYAANGPRSSR